MLRLLCCMLCVVSVAIGTLPSMSKTLYTPDFSFPATVSANAEASLKAALGSGDDITALRSLTDLSIARAIVNQDSLNSVVRRIDTTADMLKSVPARSFALMLEASVINQIYETKSWMYNRRESPLTPLPADISEWSGAQFRMRVMQLADSALRPVESLRATPLREYKSLVTGDSYTDYYFKTLYDFLAYKAIGMLSSWSATPHVFSRAYLDSDFSRVPKMRNDPVGKRILDLYASLISQAGKDSPLGILAATDRLEFVWRNVAVADGSTRPSLNESLLNLYDSYLTSGSSRPEVEWAGDILCSIGAYGLSLELERRLLQNIDEFNKAYPAYWRKKCLDNLRRSLTDKNVSVKSPSIAPSASQVRTEVTMRNVGKAHIRVYDVSAVGSIVETYVDSRTLSRLRPVADFSISVDSASALPFEATKTIDVSFPRPGVYVVVPAFEGASFSRNSYPKTYVSSVALGSQSFDGDVALFAVDASTGAPLKGVDMRLAERRGNINSSRSIGLTDARGFLSAPQDTNGNLTAVLGSDRFAAPLYFYNGGRRQRGPEDYDAVHAYTALPVYHPGDTVEFAAVLYSYNMLSRSAQADRKTTVELKNASYQTVESKEYTTDRFGRIYGSFVIPSDQLTGSFMIEFMGDDGDTLPGGVRFMVSDYKMPTFRVELDSPQRGTPSAGDVTIKGKVLAYTGFPIEGARVSLALSVASYPRFWFMSRSYKVLTLDTVADASGSFSFVVSKDDFESSAIPRGYYTASVSALSPSGETQSSEASFGLGYRYIIKPNLSPATDITGGRVVLRADLLDSDNNPVAGIPVNFRIVGTDSVVVCTGVISGGAETVDVSAVSPGRYTIYYSLTDSTLAAVADMQTVFYNLNDTHTPLPGTLLWSPSRALSVAPEGSEWIFAVDAPAHLLVTLTAENRIISREWHSCPAGLNRLPVSLPDGVDKADLTVSVVQGYRSATHRVALTRAGSEKGIEIKVESMRNSLVPDAAETWTFRITDLSGRGREAAVVADLYNTALDAIAGSEWGFIPASVRPSFPSTDLPDFSRKVSSVVTSPAGRIAECPSLEIPEIQTYGYSLAHRIVYNMARSYKMAAPMAAMTADAGNVVEESAVEADMALADDAVFVEEHAEALGSAAAAGGEEPARAEVPDFAYRESETPLAFFRPDLTSSADGTLTLSFTVPNANARWGLRLVSWTDSLLTSTYSADVVSSKPVMVQPNLPRFLRQGDDCRIEALVMNNTDSTATITTTVEIFNPADGAVVSSQTFEQTLGSHSSATAAVSLNAPADASFIGYRVRSSAGLFADGEQAVIPVCQASAPVVETYPFYMAPDANDFSMIVPSVPADARLNLQFCENPVWYVVAALPGVLELEASTAPEAAYTLFSASVAAGLVRDNPTLAEAIAEWNRSGRSSEVLTSMLERNAELKTVLLRATPWMTDAADDNSRMQRLSLLFDRDFIRSAVSKSVSLLSRLQCQDGGWSWMSGYSQSSEWTTESVLHLLGSLARMGYFPTDNSTLTGMTRKALKYYERNVKADFARYPDADYTSYVVLFDSFESIGVRPALGNVVSTTVSRILSGWKKHSLPFMAIDAMVLNRHGHPAMARTILSSVRQFAESTPEKGTWFPSLEQSYVSAWLYQGKIAATSLILDAFATIEPGCAEIDGIRQWLVMQKGAQDWGSSAITTEVIASFLQSSRTWLVPAGGSIITLDGKDITPEVSDRFTGEYQLAIPASASGEKLSVEKTADTPAWGSLYCNFTASFDSVASHSCPELSIEKSLLLTRDSQDPLLITPDTPLRPGDKVTVRLLVKCDLDMSYVAVSDMRPACLEPVEQTPRPVVSEGLVFYRENRDTETRLFIDYLPKGTYLLSYDMWVNNSGTFASGFAEIRSQYAPRYEAHSSASRVSVSPLRPE